MFRLIGEVLGLRRQRRGDNNNATNSRQPSGAISASQYESEPQRLPSLLESKLGKQVKKDYKIRELEAIDRGTFGQIYKIKTSKRSTKPLTVLKVLTAKDSSAQECEIMVAEARNEAEIVECLSGHSNIIKILKHEAYVNPLQPHLDGYYTMQFELCDKSLYKFIVEHTRIRSLLDGAVTENLFYQIGSAVEFMHERRIVHHDIKSHNIMVVDDFVQRKDLRFKLIDFGTARTYSSEWPLEETEDRLYCGTEWFMCPEKLAWHPRRTTQAAPYNPYLADVFAFGLTCIECALGFERESLVDPHYNTRDASLIRMLVKLRRLNYLNDHVRSGIARMLHRYEELRPQMHEIMKPEI